MGLLWSKSETIGDVLPEIPWGSSVDVRNLQKYFNYLSNQFPKFEYSINEFRSEQLKDFKGIYAFINTMTFWNCVLVDCTGETCIIECFSPEGFFTNKMNLLYDITRYHPKNNIHFINADNLDEGTPQDWAIIYILTRLQGKSSEFVENTKFRDCRDMLNTFCDDAQMLSSFVMVDEKIDWV